MENMGGQYEAPQTQTPNTPPQYPNYQGANNFLPPEKKRRRWPWVTLAVVFAIYITAVSFWPAPSVKATTSVSTVPAKNVTLPFPAYGTSAVAVKGGGVLAVSNNQKPAPVASTAKTMTALAIMKQKPLKDGEEGPIITIDQADVDYFNQQVREGGSTVPVKLGQQISERKALEMLLVPSANNIAFALARWAFGSVDEYTKFANDYARQLGANNSNFTDPSGLNPTTTSNAHDLVVLASELMDNSVLAEIVAQKRVDLGGGVSLPSTNSFLTLKPNVIGVKTGHHDQSGGCYIVATTAKAANGQLLTIIAAVTNAPTLINAMNDSYALAQMTAKQIEIRNAAVNGQSVGVYNAPWGASANAVARSDLAVLAWQGTELKPQAALQPTAPADSETEVGKVVANSVSGSDAAVPAVLDKQLAGPTWLWRVTHPWILFSR